MKRIGKSSRSGREHWKSHHQFEHWYIDNQVYFITARRRDRFPALASELAKAVFWDRFLHYTQMYGFTPWVTTVLDNHYHTVGYLREGLALKQMMQRIHGSVAKLVNDLLEERRSDFWRDTKGREYFDGCLRNEIQTRRAYGYTFTQSVRHGLCADWREYPHTRVNIELERALRRAHELDAFLEGVPCPHYGERPRPT